MGKINIVIGGLTLALTVLITAISIFYYSFILSDRLYQRTRQAGKNAAETLNFNYKNIMDRLTAICGTVEFASDIRTLTSPSVSYTVKERLVQNELSDLAGCNYLVQSSLVLSGDGQTAYSLYRNPLPDSAQFFTSEDLDAVQGVTCLYVQAPFAAVFPYCLWSSQSVSIQRNTPSWIFQRIRRTSMLWFSWTVQNSTRA